MEDSRWLLNVYACDDCNIGWEDEWDCACEDKCPECGKVCMPVYSLDLEDWYSTGGGEGNA